MTALTKTPWLCRLGLHLYRTYVRTTPLLAPFAVYRCRCGKECLK